MQPYNISATANNRYRTNRHGQRSTHASKHTRSRTESQSHTKIASKNIQLWSHLCYCYCYSNWFNLFNLFNIQYYCYYCCCYNNPRMKCFWCFANCGTIM